MNKVMLIGNLTRDPELRSTGTGVAVCSFTVAVERRFKDAEGNKQADFIPVVCWRQLAELCGRYLAKGRKVGVIGTLQTRTYIDKEGNKRYAYDIVADEVEFLTPKGEGGQTGAGMQSSETNFDDASGFAEMDDSTLPF